MQCNVLSQGVEDHTKKYYNDLSIKYWCMIFLFKMFELQVQAFFLHICLFLVINQMLRLGAMLQVDHIQ
jgi:hypothetical protein